ncbi:MAG: hypothetical protein WAZ12_03835 [Candidatus Absconditicoccaceae bacterium]
MTQDIIIYIIIVIIGALAILSVTIGLEKMIKIILGNYILSSICLAASQSINLLINYLNNNSGLMFFGIKNDALSNFLLNGQTTIIMIIYAGLLWAIYKKSKISVNIPQDEILKKSLYIFFVPLTVISFILTIQIAITGISIFSVNNSIEIGNIIIDNIYIQMFIKNTPLWILLHGIATILITSELKIKIKTDI